MSELIVAKFGGTSVQDAQSMLRCAKIVSQNQRIKIVVVSATGKTTNALEKVAKEALTGELETAELSLTQIRDKHFELAFELGTDAGDLEKIKLSLEKIIEEGRSYISGIVQLKECSKRTLDSIYALGERMSSILFVAALRQVKIEADNFDARSVIITNDSFNKADPDYEQINLAFQQKLKHLLAEDHVIVTQGFIGSTKDGLITTLGREGSDFSAAIFAWMTDAHAVQIWTDVPGVATFDPRLIQNVEYIPEMNYETAKLLSLFGAKVLHPKTLGPAIKKNIPVFVGNSLNPSQKGTWIKESVKSYRLDLAGIAERSGQRLVTLRLKDPIDESLFIQMILQLLRRFNIDFDLVSFTQNQLSFVLGQNAQLGDELMNELGKLSIITVEEGLSLVSLVGEDLLKLENLLGRVFTCLSNFKIRAMSFGAHRSHLGFMLPETESLAAIKILHREFFSVRTSDQGTL